MTGIFELCNISGFNNSGMADSWSEELVRELLTTDGNGGWRTYCDKFDGTETSAVVVAEAVWSESAVIDCDCDSESAGNTAATKITHHISYVQDDHFPDHMKFPDFSLTFPVKASKDYPVSSVYRYGQQSMFHINEKQGEARQSII